MNNGLQKVRLREGPKRERLRREKPAAYEKVVRYEEKARRGESVAIIDLNYDYTCNFACKHCCIENFRIKKGGAQRHLTPENVKELYKQGDEIGLANTVISGGEPLTYKDFDKVVEAIDPSRWYIACDTNGWHLDEKKARHLKSIGVNRVQISLDSFDAEEHDRLRNQPGSYSRVLRAVDASLGAGLEVILLTVMWKDRARSKEFLKYLEFAKSKGIGAYVTYAKPVGAWEGNYAVLCGDEELKYIEGLEKKYDVFTHLTPAYGLDIGCIAVKRIIVIARYGDVMPCPYMFVSLGNIFQEGLKDILERGLKIKHFAYGEKHTCLLGNKDCRFMKDYMAKMHGRKGAVPYNEVFTAEDFIE